MAHSTTVGLGLAVPVTPSDDLQALMDAAPVNTIFRLAPGTYRPAGQEGFQPKAGQRIIGRGLGVVLSGAKALTGWTVSGSQWWASAFLPASNNGVGFCTADGEGGLCTHRQNVFRDGVPLVRVASAAAATTGKFFTDYAANRVYVGDDPNGHLVEQAWNNHVVKGTVHHVMVANVVVEMCANQAQEGAIAARGGNWTVEYCELRYNHGAGVECETGGAAWFHHNHIHHNGQIGIAGRGPRHVIEYNLIEDNNTRGFDIGWDAGGMKIGEETLYDVTVRGNVVLRNVGPGIWFDSNAGTADIDGNYVKNNQTGIMYEISFGKRPDGTGGPTLIRNNTTVDNYQEDAAGIAVHASPWVEVTGNATYNERANILLFQQDRSGDTADPHGRGAHENKFNHVSGNFCDLNGYEPDWTGKFGLWTDIVGGLGASIYTGAYDNTFTDNDHRHANASQPWFDWSTTFRTFAQWQAFGHDATGSMTAGSALTPPDPPTLVVGPRP